jgi:hypothetical protein
VQDITNSTKWRIAVKEKHLSTENIINETKQPKETAIADIKQHSGQVSLELLYFDDLNQLQ